MDAACDAAVREIWVQKSAQVGWTEILNNVIGYFVDQDPSPILIVQPTEEVAVDWSRDRLAPMIRDTPCLRAKFTEERTRTTANTLRHKTFKGGLLAVAISNSPSSLASKPIRVALFDEVDKYPVSAKQAGDPFSLGKKRTTTFWNRKIMAGSTPTIKGVSRVERGFETSDQRYYFVPCPHCDEFQRLVWAQVRWPEGQPQEAVYVCVHCGVALAETDKAEMLRRGEWRASKPFSGVAGFHISELYSPWSTWAEVAVAFLAAKRLPETLQQWTNEALGETWEETGQVVEPEGLLARREPYDVTELPPGVLMLTVGGDVQDDRVEIQLLGWGADEECWPIEQAIIRGDPGDRKLWAEVDDYLKRKYRTEDGRQLVVEASAFDSGGHHTQAVYDYCVARRRFRVWAIKGQAGAGRLAWPKRSSRVAKSRVPLFVIGVDTIKATLYGRLEKVAGPGPGYIHIPASFDDELCKQLTSEVRVRVYVKGRPVTAWKPRAQGVRQEAQDCWVYGYAAMIGRGGAGLLARRAASKPEPVADEPEPEPVPPVPVVTQPSPFDRPRRPAAPMHRSNWVKGW